MALIVALLVAALAYLVWLAWFDARHHQGIESTAAALLAAVIVGLLIVIALAEWVVLPVGPTIGASIVVAAVIRYLTRPGASARADGRSPLHNP